MGDWIWSRMNMLYVLINIIAFVINIILLTIIEYSLTVIVLITILFYLSILTAFMPIAIYKKCFLKVILAGRTNIIGRIKSAYPTIMGKIVFTLPIISTFANIGMCIYILYSLLSANCT